MREFPPIVSLEMWFGTTFLLAFVACVVVSFLHAHGCSNEISNIGHETALGEGTPHARKSLDNEAYIMAKNNNVGKLRDNNNNNNDNNYNKNENKNKRDNNNDNNKRDRIQARLDPLSKNENGKEIIILGKKGFMTRDWGTKEVSLHASNAGSFTRIVSRADNRVQGPVDSNVSPGGEQRGTPPFFFRSPSLTRVGVDFLADLRWRSKRANSNPLETSRKLNDKATPGLENDPNMHKNPFLAGPPPKSTLATFDIILPSDTTAIRKRGFLARRRMYFYNTRFLRFLTNFYKNRRHDDDVGASDIKNRLLAEYARWEKIPQQNKELIDSKLFDRGMNIAHAKRVSQPDSQTSRTDVPLGFPSHIANGASPNKLKNSTFDVSRASKLTKAEDTGNFNDHSENASATSVGDRDFARESMPSNTPDLDASRDSIQTVSPDADVSRDSIQPESRDLDVSRDSFERQARDEGVSRDEVETKRPDPTAQVLGHSGPKTRHVRSVQAPPSGSTKNIRARREGDAIIGALFPLHQAPTQKTAYTRQCGKIREYYGIQRVEAFLMTLENINTDPSILPGIKLGWDIRDSCWYSAIALENSIDFIKDAIASQSANAQASLPVEKNPGRDRVGHVATPAGRSSDPKQLNASSLSSSSSPSSSLSSSSTRSSTTNQTGQAGCVDRPHLKPIAGLVGPGSSEATIQVQNLLQIFNIPEIGYSATSIDLSDKSHYKYFLRVVPPDRYQAQALVDVVVNFNWTYISTVHSDGNYGIKGMEMFTDLAKAQGVCIGTTDNVASTASDEQFDNVVTNLMETPNATVVVCFCEGLTVKNLLLALRRRQAEGRFMIVGSDGWGNRLDVVEGLESTAVGGISIKLYSPPFSNFSAHYSQLGPERSKENPWFQPFWEEKFHCSLDELRQDLRGYKRFCSGHESLAGSDQDSKLGFVVNAVTTMAKALHNMREDLCPGSKGLCSAMDPINGSVYLKYLLNVSFWDYSGELVHFDSKGDPPGRYEILNYQRVASPDGNLTYKYVTIGHWMTGKLNLSEQLVQWPAEPSDSRTTHHERRSRRSPVKSVCSEPCGKNQAKKVKGVACCWICATCLDNQILIQNNTDCKSCDLGFWPNDNKTNCEIIPEEFISWQDTQAIVCLAISCLGMCWTLWVAVIFIRFHDTPVVKASTRELSYIILVGIALAFSANLFIVAKPKREFCYLTRILPGLSFSLIYGALVTKTNRIARILEGSKRISTKKPRFMSASAQVVITGMIIGMECAVITGMLIYQPANSKLHYPEPRRARLVCDTSTLGIVVPLGFDLVLILLCTLYAVKTRNLPENFNEAKFIGFTMYATCVIWLGFFPIYFAGENKEVTLSVSISLSAAIALLLLFVPKVYVIIWVPERNTRGAFTTSRDVRCHIGSKSMASGDSIDIKESSTYENLFRSDKTGVNSKQWKQKSLDEKRLRFVMQRVSDPEHASSYINHGVLGKKTHLGSCGVLTKISKDSTRTESSHISALSSCSEKEKTLHGDTSPSELLPPPGRSAKLRPASPSEKEKHRIHNASRDDQQLLENLKMSGFENCKVVPAYFRKSLSSTCVSSHPRTRTVHCQTSDDLAQTLFPALRRRRCVPGGGEHRLVRSSAVDDANCELETASQLDDYSSIRSDNFSKYSRSQSSDRTTSVPFVIRQSTNPLCVCRDASARQPLLNQDRVFLPSSRAASGHQRRSRDLDLAPKKPKLSTLIRPDFVNHPRRSPREKTTKRDSCPLHDLAEKPDSLELGCSSSEDEACCSCIHQSDAPTSCHSTHSPEGQHTSHLPFPSSSFFQPIHGSCSHSISSASSSSTLPPFNTSTESTKSNHSCGGDTNDDFHTFISMDTDEEEDDDFINELSPLRMESAEAKSGRTSENNANAPLQIFVEEENDMIEFQKYLKTYGVKLDLSSVQSSDL